MDMHTTTRRLAQATCLSLAIVCSSASAQVAIEQQPLVVATPLEPNILFILDDSTSMTWDYLPNDAPSGTISRTTYPDNAIAYNPLTTYLPWYQANGNLMGNANRTSVSTNANTLGGSTNLLSNAQCFHVRDPDSNTLYRWRLNTNGTSITRCSAHATCTNTSGCGTASSASITWNHGTTPVTRTVAQEWQNYANWYHYHRTRMKVAKAAASKAFTQLGESYRIGFAAINRTSGNVMDIPVLDDDGLFLRGHKNRNDWFKALQDAAPPSGTQYTPLRSALDRAGRYFQSASETGPWGPGPVANQFSCRQNFAILTTDGYWNTRNDTNLTDVDNSDGTNGPTITGPGGASFTYSATAPYSDSTGNTLADIAMHYWKNDLRPDLPNNVPTSAGNPAFWQHMVTFGISLGAPGTLNPSVALPQILSGNLSWPAPTFSPTGGNGTNIDDLWHATINSRGEYILASDADAFSSALGSALGAIADRLGSGASLAANSTRLEDPGARFTFQAQYWSGSWRGDLSAFAIDKTSGVIAADTSWRAADRLSAVQPTDRKIFVSTGLSGGNAYRTFTWSNLSSAQQTLFNNESIVSGTSATGSDIVAYLRGVRTLEQTQAGTGILRSRTSILGDIVNSQPVYVGAPDPKLHEGANFTGASAYAAFASAQATRTPVVYVGANDGMLHGFNADTGDETYAFIPNAAIQNGLAKLADPSYGKDSGDGGIPHRFFVDGELTVADVFTNSTGWRTVLIGTMGRSDQRAVFALDVTDPANVGFLWERRHTDIPALGQNIGKPVIVKLGNNNWKVLIGNGFNSTGGSAQLLMLDVFSGNLTAVTTGASPNNGLSAVFPWDSNGDGFTDTAYAGDRLGNLWRFTGLGGTPSVSKLFEARSSTGVVQPITAAPLVGRNFETNERWVFFGTGQYLNNADVSSSAVQTWYGLIDKGTAISGRGALKKRDIIAEGVVNQTPARAISESTVGDMAGLDGWYIDLISSENGAEGERMITPNQFRAGALIGTTRIPDGSDPCNPSGRGYVMAINPFNGARLVYSFFDISRDGKFDEEDTLTVGDVKVPASGVGFGAGPNNPIFLGNAMFVSLDDGSRAAFNTSPPPTGNAATRRSWREILR